MIVNNFRYFNFILEHLVWIERQSNSWFRVQFQPSCAINDKLHWFQPIRKIFMYVIISIITQVNIEFPARSLVKNLESYHYKLADVNFHCGPRSDQIGILECWFLQREENRRRTLVTRERTNSTHMKYPSWGLNPRPIVPQRWEPSVLPDCLSSHCYGTDIHDSHIWYHMHVTLETTLFQFLQSPA
jgi:hypothetical protein